MSDQRPTSPDSEVEYIFVDPSQLPPDVQAQLHGQNSGRLNPDEAMACQLELQGAMDRVKSLLGKLDRASIEAEMQGACIVAARLGDQRWLRFLKELTGEIRYYLGSKIKARPGASAAAAEDCSGGLASFSEAWDMAPQAVFQINLADGRRYIGRKYLSQRWLDQQINELHCSLIYPDMLLGTLVQEQVSEDGITLYYEPISATSKISVLKELAHEPTSDLRFPYPHLTPGFRRERASPPGGWQLTEGQRESLSEGEAHFRDYTLRWLSTFDMQRQVVFDPACSTGDFLKSIKEAYPLCRTIGQDLSESMISHAAQVVDEAILGDARGTTVADDTVDFAFVRFLNSEVVTTAQATELFLTLAGKVKRGGHLILFGHTPVLVPLAFMRRSGLTVCQSTAFLADDGPRFQYFVLKKSTPP